MPLYYDIPPETTPVTLAEVKTFLRIGTVATYDEELQMCIDAMCDKEDINNPAQFAYKSQLVKATLIVTLSGFSRKIELPRPPLVSVSSVEYRDSQGEWQVANDYEANTKAIPGFIRFANNFEFPALYETEDYPIRITYEAGYETTPASVKLWIMNHVGDYWHERKGQILTNMDLVELKAAMGQLKAPHNAARRFG